MISLLARFTRYACCLIGDGEVKTMSWDITSLRRNVVKQTLEVTYEVLTLTLTLTSSSCCLLQSHSLTCKKWGYHINLLLICNSLVNDYNFREIFTKADQNNTNTHSHVLHHAWSLEVFEDDDGLEVVQHKDVITRLQGVRTSVRQFICNCQEFLLGLLQDSKAVIQC